jgi:hypothetical protein
MLRLTLAFAALIFCAETANALTKTDFAVSGFSGIQGNGLVFATPRLYGIGEVDFDTTVWLTPKAPDGRNPLSHIGTYHTAVYYLKDGVGGLSPHPLELWQATGLFTVSDHSVVCFQFCDPIEFDLKTTIPAGYNGVQFAFQGDALTAVPLPPAGLLFLGSLLIGGLTAKRKKLVEDKR